MRLIVVIVAALCALLVSSPALAASYPRSLEIALEDHITDYIEEEYSFMYEDGDYDCERVRFRTYECGVMFDATALHDVTITDAYGDEVTVMQDDELECYVDAEARRRAAWSRLGRYRIALDELECEVVTE